MKEQRLQIQQLQKLYIEEAEAYLDLVKRAKDAEKFIEKRELLIKLGTMLEKIS